METDKLRYFSVIAQTESIRKAAEILHMTPSALSKVLHQLEAELDVTLTTPLGRGITLTAEGRKLAVESQKIIQELDQLKRQITIDKEKKKESPLRLASHEVFSTYFLQALQLVEWGERGLILHEMVPGEIERAVEQDIVDLGITYMPIPYKNVEFLKITSVEMGVFKRKGSFAKERQEDLPFVTPVYPVSGTPTRARGLDGWPEDAYCRKVLYEVTLMESGLELCRQGRCAGYFPTFVIDAHNNKHKSEFQLERHASPYVGRKCYTEVYIVKRKDLVENQMVKLLAKMIRLTCK